LHRVPAPDDCSGKLWEMDPSTWSGAKGFIFGLVAAWGTVLIGTDGWRAQHGRPIALYVPPGSRISLDGRLDLVLANYPVPVIWSFDDLVSEWAPQGLDLLGVGSAV